MSAWLRVVLAAQVLFFSVWGASLLRSHAHVRVVWLATPHMTHAQATRAGTLNRKA